MAPIDSVPTFQARLALYRIDDQTRSLLAQTWPTIAPYLDRVIDNVVMAVIELPNIGKAVAQNQDLVKKLEVAHFQALLGGQLNQRYAESCRQTVQQEAAIGLDARIRSTAGSFMLKAALDALARKHRFSAAKLAARGKIVAQVISFDVANAMTLHRQAAEQAALARRSAIDVAITDFAGAIGEVVEAIKKASVSLTTTGSTLMTCATILPRSASLAEEKRCLRASASSAALSMKLPAVLRIRASRPIAASCCTICRQDSA